MIIQINKTVFLQGKNISYVLMENDEGDLLNFHFGGKLAARDYASDAQLCVEGFPSLSNTVFLSSFPQEYPAYGHTDARSPAYQVVNQYGNAISRLKLREYRIHKGEAVGVRDMPCLFGSGEDVDTLEVVLEDAAIALEVRLYYVVFSEYDVIARHAVLINKADKPVTLRSAYSANLDLPEDRFDLIYFAGEWGRERGLERTPLHRGMRADITDTTGRGSREVNPFVMLAASDADETHGLVYGFNLIYSCNHSTLVQADCNGRVRVQQGISPQAFAWELQPSESFCTPQCVMCFSDSGIGELSRQYHRLYREHLMQSSWTHRPRPVLINNWEATYFDFDEEKLLDMARTAKSVGVDLFVLDDGWFGKRDDGRSSLGDWFAYAKKLPNGIEGLAKKINDAGMMFGLWFEPEMISPDSDLYRRHPDWAIRVPQMEPALQRWQLVLDLSRREVCEYVVKTVGDLLRCGRISYVKWDMNRIISDVPCLGYYHRYALGLYRIMRELTGQFPDILFEGCCSGGGRFDPGVLAYMPQIWASDNSDAISRLRIQYSTSMCYPLSSIGTHVTAVPNHQTGRVTSLKTRADIACTGVFGYELDVTKATREELEQIKKQTAFAKDIQALVHNGELHRLRSPFETNECIIEVVSREKDHVLLVACRVLSVIGRHKYYEPKVKLRGLDEDADYIDAAADRVYGGSLLMHRGLTISYEIEDFTTVVMELKQIPRKN